MVGNPWHQAVIGRYELERRHELGYQARLQRQAQGWRPSGAARLLAWIGGQLIRVGEALRRVERTDQGTRPSLKAHVGDLWRTHPSRI